MVIVILMYSLVVGTVFSDDAVANSSMTNDFEDNEMNYESLGVEEYDYDDNGNLTMDLNKGISEIEYEHNNLPKLVTFSDNIKIQWIYSANGTKLRKNVFDASGDIVYYKDFANGFVYKGKKKSIKDIQKR